MKVINSGILPLIAASLFVFGCSESGTRSNDGTGSNGPATRQASNDSGSKGQVRTVSGALTNAEGETAVGARTSDGRQLKAVMDPATNRFSVNLPKGVSAVVSIKSGGVVAKVAFLKATASGKADAGDSYSYEIPETPFVEDADLGELDLSDVVDGDLLVGDEAGETSIWAYVDEDLDGLVDIDDLDDDGDGIADLLDEDWKDELEKWMDLDDEDAWDFFELDDFCDLDAEDAEMCIPSDGEWFSEEECDDEDEDASAWCTFEGEDGFYSSEDAEEWWNEANDKVQEAVEGSENPEELDEALDQVGDGFDQDGDEIDDEAGEIDDEADEIDADAEAEGDAQDAAADETESCLESCEEDCGTDYMCIADCATACVEASEAD